MVVSLLTSLLDHISTILHLHTATAHPSTLEALARAQALVWWVLHPAHKGEEQTMATTGATTPWEEAHTGEDTSTGAVEEE